MLTSERSFLGWCFCPLCVGLEGEMTVAIPHPCCHTRFDCLDYCSSMKSFVGLWLTLPSVLCLSPIGPPALWLRVCSDSPWGLLLYLFWVENLPVIPSIVPVCLTHGRNSSYISIIDTFPETYYYLKKSLNHFTRNLRMSRIKSLGTNRH